jgi:histidinol phosphatase-like PHP family hydrolase
MATGRQPGQFEQFIQRGRYLFHIHTDWTDGKSTLADYCIAAKEIGFQSMILLEHVRRECTYDFRAFLRMVEEQRSAHAMNILVGAEAKILPDGFLDISEAVLSDIQVLGIAEHSFRGDVNMLVHALGRAFESYRGAEFARVWVHPGLRLLQWQPMSPQFFQEAMRLALEHELYVEINLRYNLPPEPFISFIPSSKAVVGVDAHSVDEVKRLGEIILDLESTIADRSSTRAKRGDYEAR